MAAARDRAVHPGTAHLLQRGLLLDHHLDHARAAEVHRRVAVHHRDVVAERRDVRTARGRRAEQGADLRDRARRAHLGVEDLPGSAPAGEHLDLVGDPRAGRVDQVDHRQAGRVGLLDDPDDLLDGPSAPGSRLDRGVVGHQRDRASADRSRAGDDAVRREPVGARVSEDAVLGQAVLVDQHGDPVPREELARRRRGGMVFLGTASRDPGPDAGEVLVARTARVGSGVGVGAWSRLRFAHGRERT